MADADNPFAGATVADFQPIDPQTGQVVVKRAEPAQQSVASIVPDMDKHDPVTYGSLTADHALRQVHAQGLNMTPEDYFKVQDDAMGKAIEYQAHQRQTLYTKGLEEGQKLAEVAPPSAEQPKGGYQYQLEELKRKEEEVKGQWGEGPGAQAAALAQPGGLAAGKVTGLDPQQEKELAAYTDGFYNLQKLHGLFDNMVQKTATSGGELRSGFGFLSPVSRATSVEARDYHSFVDFALVGLAKGLQGDSASGASKDTIQANMKEALPNDTDNAISGGHKIYNMMDSSYHRLLAMRNAMAGKQDTSAMDRSLVEMQNYMQRPEVQKYNPMNAANQPLITAGNSPQAQAQVLKAAGAGTNPPPNVAQPGAPVAPNRAYVPPGQGLQMTGTGSGLGLPPMGQLPLEQPSPLEQGLVNLPGQVKQLLTPRPGGPTQDLTLPPSLGTVYGQ